MDYCDCNPDFGIADPVTEITVKPSTKQTVEILVSEVWIVLYFWFISVLYSPFFGFFCVPYVKFKQTKKKKIVLSLLVIGEFMNGSNALLYGRSG